MVAATAQRKAGISGRTLTLADTAEPAAGCCVPLAKLSISQDEAKATASMFKALGDPHRVRILNLLMNAVGPACVCDITDVIGLSQPTTSFHLKKLVAAGLLRREQRGVWAYYSIDQHALRTLSNLVEPGTVIR